ncbi:MAG TPA: type II toxin-antitoxin system HicB family antitoxin [Hymenobacter sp.]|jgi:predicted RNase H-like HicB family nuclease
MKLTLVIRKGTSHLIGQIKEIPGVLTQGQTVEEVKENITDALALYLEDIREDNSDSSGIILQEELEFA